MSGRSGQFQGQTQPRPDRDPSLIATLDTRHIMIDPLGIKDSRSYNSDDDIVYLQGRKLSYFRIKGHVVLLPQDMTCLLNLLPMSPSTLPDIVHIV